MKTKVKNTSFVQLSVFKDKRGRLLVGESDHFPFQIKRIFFIDNIPQKAKRAKHAHYKNKEVVFCLNGSVEVLLDDGFNQEKAALNDPNTGLFIGPDVWREFSNFSKGAVLVALADGKYDKKDYINDHSVFTEMAKKKKKR